MAFLLANLPLLFTVLALTVAEMVHTPAKADWRLNLQAWLLVILVGLFIQPLFRATGMHSLVDGATLPFWVAFPLFLIVADFGEFLYHRMQHQVPFLWAMHSLHHSDPEMSALTTQRHFWGDQLVKTVTIWAGAALIIAPTSAMVGAYALVSLWNFVAHSRLRVDLGRWSWVINSPAYHRRHHSRLPEHFDTNFAALFPVFDVLFGSYRRPDGWPPTGLDKAPETMRDLLNWPLIWDEAEQAAETPQLSEA